MENKEVIHRLFDTVEHYLTPTIDASDIKKAAFLLATTRIMINDFFKKDNDLYELQLKNEEMFSEWMKDYDFSTKAIVVQINMYRDNAITEGYKHNMEYTKYHA